MAGLGNPLSYTSTRPWSSGPNGISVDQTEIPRTKRPRNDLNYGSNQILTTNHYVNQNVHVGRFFDQSEMNLYMHLVFGINPEEMRRMLGQKEQFPSGAAANQKRKKDVYGLPGIASSIPGQGDQIMCCNLMKLNQMMAIAAKDWKPEDLTEDALNQNLGKLFDSIDFMGTCITPEYVTRSRTPLSADVRVFRIMGQAFTYDIFDPMSEYDPAPSDVVYVLLVVKKASEVERLNFSVQSETIPIVDEYSESKKNMVATKGTVRSFDMPKGQLYPHLTFYVDREMHGPPPFVRKDKKADPCLVVGYWKIGRIREMSEQGQMNFPLEQQTYTVVDNIDYERDAIKTKMVKQCEIYLNPVKGQFSKWSQASVSMWKTMVEGLKPLDYKLSWQAVENKKEVLEALGKGFAVELGSPEKEEGAKAVEEEEEEEDKVVAEKKEEEKKVVAENKEEGDEGATVDSTEAQKLETELKGYIENFKSPSQVTIKLNELNQRVLDLSVVPNVADGPGVKKERLDVLEEYKKAVTEFKEKFGGLLNQQKESGGYVYPDKDREVWLIAFNKAAKSTSDAIEAKEKAVDSERSMGTAAKKVKGHRFLVNESAM